MYLRFGLRQLRGSYGYMETRLKYFFYTNNLFHCQSINVLQYLMLHMTSTAFGNGMDCLRKGKMRRREVSMCRSRYIRRVHTRTRKRKRRRKRERKGIKTSDASDASDASEVGFGLVSASAFASPPLTLGNL